MNMNIPDDTALVAPDIKAREDPPSREEQIKAAAMQTLAAIGVTRPSHIDVEKIAASVGAEIAFDDLDGAAARVIKIGGRARIVVSTRIADPGAIRFTIAHEIGHLACKHTVRSGTICAPRHLAESRAEREASMFATELLMPAPLVARWCAATPASLAPVRAIANACQTSLLTSAMRFVELTPERCALVYSELGRVRWAKRSRSFRAHIPEGRLVDPAAAAFDYFDWGVIEESSRIVPPGTWLTGHRRNATLLEHASAVTETGAVFSLLWMPAT